MQFFTLIERHTNGVHVLACSFFMQKLLEKYVWASGMPYASCKLTLNLKNNEPRLRRVSQCKISCKQRRQSTHRGYAIIRSTEMEVLLLASFCVEQAKPILIIVLNSCLIEVMSNSVLLQPLTGVEAGTTKCITASPLGINCRRYANYYMKGNKLQSVAKDVSTFHSSLPEDATITVTKVTLGTIIDTPILVSMQCSSVPPIHSNPTLNLSHS